MAIVWSNDKDATIGKLFVAGEVVREYRITGNVSMWNLSLTVNGEILRDNDFSPSRIEQAAEADAREYLDYLNYLNQSTPD